MHEARMNRLEENVEEVKADLSHQLHLFGDIINKMTQRFEEYIRPEDNDKLALRQAVKATRLKILAELAKDNREEFSELVMNRYKYLPQLPAPFAARWQTIRQTLNITRDEKVMSRMEIETINPGNIVAHEKFTQSYDELVGVAKTMKNSDYYLFFLDLNKKLNALRPGDSLFDTQDKAFIT